MKETTLSAVARAWRGALARFPALAGVPLLAACATAASIDPGMTRDVVLARIGRPAQSYALASPADRVAGAAATQRMEYPGALFQSAWLVDLDDAGRVLSVTQSHSPERFAQVRVGVDDQTAVRRLLGTPYEVQRYALSGLTAWHYPYRDVIWNLEMTVEFDAAGIVQRMENGPDRRFDRGGDRRF